MPKLGSIDSLPPGSPYSHRMAEPLVHYQSADEDSAIWNGFDFRPGDIVISTRSKTGTTWLQMICLLLVFQEPELPRPLSELSPWLDWLVYPDGYVFELLAAQDHRRVIKTHTPLDGIPIDPRASYLVAGRHPLDMGVSLYHQGNNINREKWRELTGQAPVDEPPGPRPTERDWLLEWVFDDVDFAEDLDSLQGLMHHLSDAWARRDQSDVVLVHYADLQVDLAGQMHDLADRLEFTVPEAVWPTLVEAATFAQMSKRPDYLLPAPSGVLMSASAFFRRGTSGSGRALLTDAEFAQYTERVSDLGPPDLVEWLHHEPGSVQTGEVMRMLSRD